MFGETHAKETADKINGHIRGAVREAIDEGIIRIDFTRNAKVIGKVPAKKKSEKYLNYVDSELLLKELKSNLSKGLGILSTTSCINNRLEIWRISRINSQRF